MDIYDLYLYLWDQKRASLQGALSNTIDAFKSYIDGKYGGMENKHEIFSIMTLFELMLRDYFNYLEMGL